MTVKSFFALPPHGTPWTLDQAIKFQQRTESKENKKTKIIVNRLLFLRSKVGNTIFDSKKVASVTNLKPVTVNNLLRFLVNEKIISKVGKLSKRSFYYQFNSDIENIIADINNRNQNQKRLKDKK